jgi:ribonuclease III family protein
MADPLKMNTTALAYMGDAVYEAFVREHVIKSGRIHADWLHRSGVKYVCAASQAKVIKELLPSLSPEEALLVNRAKNHRIATKPKNADPITYKWATAFEALIGYLFLSGQRERLESIVASALTLTESKDNAQAISKDR